MHRRDAPPGHTTQRDHAFPTWQLHVIEGLYYICPVSLGWVAAASVFFDLQRFDTAAFVAGLVRRDAPPRCARDGPATRGSARAAVHVARAADDRPAWLRYEYRLVPRDHEVPPRRSHYPCLRRSSPQANVITCRHRCGHRSVRRYTDRTNIIMLKLLSIARNALVVISGVILYRESLAPMQICG